MVSASTLRDDYKLFILKKGGHWQYSTIKFVYFKQWEDKDCLVDKPIQ